MQNSQYIPSDFDIGKIKQALITGDAAQRAYALRLVEAWPRPGDDHGFTDTEVAHIKKYGSN